ncbi:MAG TPA: Spy/CpxP family protein refolding chaperone [Bryobacteraceae bacterium]
MKRNLMQFATVAALAAGMAFAQTQAPAPQPGQGKHFAGKGRFARRGFARGRMMQALNLTDAQKQQAKSIFQESRQSTQPLRAQLKQDRQALAEAAKAGNTTQIQQLSTDAGSVLGKLTAARAEAMGKFYNILTPEQKAKADAMKQRMQQRRKNG